MNLIDLTITVYLIMGKGSEVRKETKDGETGEKRVNKLVQK